MTKSNESENPHLIPPSSASLLFGLRCPKIRRAPPVVLSGYCLTSVEAPFQPILEPHVSGGGVQDSVSLEGTRNLLWLVRNRIFKVSSMRRLWPF